MNRQIDPHLVHSGNPFLLDFISEHAPALRLFESAPDGFSEVMTAREHHTPASRDAVAEALDIYNRQLGASARSLANLEALRDVSTLCVVGGQQAGFFGGPVYTLYKALSVVRLASSLEDRLGVRVVPIFWLATEDHDFTEINRVRFLEPDGSIRTISFDWSGRGHPIEHLSITPDVANAAREVLDRFPEGSPARGLFEAEAGDDYGTWHARIWSRLFADVGLILVEPRILRSLAGRFYQAVLSDEEAVSSAAEAGADLMRQASYVPPLDPALVGRLFRIDESGIRSRVEHPKAHAKIAHRSPEHYSPGAALRPILADCLLPTVANVLGPSEMAYHAMLLPLYQLLEVPQPVPIPRQSYTILSAAEDEFLRRLNVPIESALSGNFDAKRTLTGAASGELLRAFAEARANMTSALIPLLEPLSELDPGLHARWRQTSDHAKQAIDRLEERAIHADLARRGLSRKRLHELLASLRPKGKPQERTLSFAHFANLFGVEWVKALPGSEHPDRFAHHVVTVRGDE